MLGRKTLHCIGSKECTDSRNARRGPPKAMSLSRVISFVCMPAGPSVCSGEKKNGTSPVQRSERIFFFRRPAQFCVIRYREDDWRFSRRIRQMRSPKKKSLGPLFSLWSQGRCGSTRSIFFHGAHIDSKRKISAIEMARHSQRRILFPTHPPPPESCHQSGNDRVFARNTFIQIRTA